MFLSLDLANLLLYCAQQLGVTLGVGAQAILLVAYLQSIRDGIIDDKEAQFARAVRAVSYLGLFLIVVSGVGITVLHVSQSQADVLLQPAYLFKWALIIFILLLNVFTGAIPLQYLEGLRGGTWFALFVVHILAPVTTWMNLLTLYALWMVGFNLVWMALVPLMHERRKNPRPIALESKPAPAPKPAPKMETKIPAQVPAAPFIPVPPPPFAPPKPAPASQPALPVVVQAALTAPGAVATPKKPPAPPAPVQAPQSKEQDGLPAIRVMPKTPQDAEKESSAINQQK